MGGGADAAVFSFQAVKNLPTADGGMVCFQDAALDAEARRSSWLGIDKDTFTRTQSGRPGYRWLYDVEHVGFKYHGNSIMAALGLVGLKYLDDDNRRPPASSPPRTTRRSAARGRGDGADGGRLRAVAASLPDPRRRAATR